jgi:hypothetical protein
MESDDYPAFGASRRLVAAVVGRNRLGLVLINRIVGLQNAQNRQISNVGLSLPIEFLSDLPIRLGF